jgi:3-oxoacyl-(acyl-carrier-protein) synthase
MPQVPIAIVGASALFAGSTDAQGFWRDILAGRDLITDVPPTHWLIEDYYDPDPSAPDKTYSKRGAFIPEVPFDPMEFGVPPSILPATDSAQILALIVAQRVLDDATQGQFAKIDRERASVILGVTSGQELLGTMVSRLQRPVWLKALRDAGIPESEAKDVCERIAKEYVPWQESSFPGLLGNVVAGRIANRFDLRGTNCVTDAACASALSALSMAINELVVGQSDLVIAGGVDTMNDIFMYMCFSKTPALSKSGDCRPFSDAADGTLLGEGMAMLALKRLDDAERDGDRVYAVIRGIGSSSDGRSKSVYAPLPEGQARALRPRARPDHRRAARSFPGCVASGQRWPGPLRRGRRRDRRRGASRRRTRRAQPAGRWSRPRARRPVGGERAAPGSGGHSGGASRCSLYGWHESRSRAPLARPLAGSFREAQHRRCSGMTRGGKERGGARAITLIFRQFPLANECQQAASMCESSAAAHRSSRFRCD